LIVVFIGIRILVPGLWNLGKGPLSRDQIDLMFIMGGGEFKVTSRQLKGGKVTAIMGGCTLDLRDAEIDGDEITLDTFAMMGGIEIIVPTGWQVNMQGFPLLGGMTNSALLATKSQTVSSAPSSAKRLVITGVALMGGVEAKN
jgi:predicted membrane protein